VWGECYKVIPKQPSEANAQRGECYITPLQENYHPTLFKEKEAKIGTNGPKREHVIREHAPPEHYD
jgi:hypothetical protein